MSIGYTVAKNDEIIKNSINKIEKYEKKNRKAIYKSKG